MHIVKCKMVIICLSALAMSNALCPILRLFEARARQLKQKTSYLEPFFAKSKTFSKAGAAMQQFAGGAIDFQARSAPQRDYPAIPKDTPGLT